MSWIEENAENYNARKTYGVGGNLIDVKFVRLRNYPTSTIWKYANPTDACFDIYAAEDVLLKQGVATKVKTGVALAIPEGYEVQIRARSSMGAKGIIIPNGIGTIDAGYRGEIMGLFVSLECDYQIKLGDRIAQGCIKPVYVANFIEVTKEELEPSSRGSGGFGSTGV